MTSELKIKDTSNYNQNPLDSKNSPGSTRAVYLETLNLTRNSLHFAESDFPRTPSPVHDPGSLTGPLRFTAFHAEAKKYKEYERVADVESAIPRMELMSDDWGYQGESSTAAMQSTFRSALEYTF